MSVDRGPAVDAGPERAAEHVGFLVVGSPRSGTTLVQRLACELPGVRMPPETHFFSQFASGLLSRRSFPLQRAELTEELSRFAGLDTSRGLDIDVDAVVGHLGGSCPSPLALFDALVRHLCGPAQMWGEKTPDHLLWWRSLSRAAPWLRFVAVVRDPRAVVASNLEMPWSRDRRLPAWGDRVHLAFAVHWAVTQGQTRAMSHGLGPGRCLVVRYEDVVADPSRARARIGDFLGRPVPTEPSDAPAGIVPEWEPWKLDALAPVDAARVKRWHELLDGRRARQITAICRSGMRQFGYGQDAPDLAEGALVLARLGPRPLARLVRYRRTYAGYARVIDRRQL
jgi:hypothetical protein